MIEAREAYLSRLRPGGSKRSKKRDLIVDVFLGQEGHLSADDLVDIVRREDPKIGRATVYRTLQWMVDASIARKVDFGEGRARFEHSYRHPRHFHLVCSSCNHSAEFLSSDIEQLIEEVTVARNFSSDKSVLQIYGLCEKCKSGQTSVTEEPATESLFARDALQPLLNRPDFIIEHEEKIKTVSLSETGKNIDLEKLDSDAIDVEADVPHVHAARIHPLKDTINEIRETFVHLGFTEINGNLSQSSFWNFDALFTPQDHPARELQDTFYLKDLNAKQLATPTQIKNVSNAHKKGWRYYWDIQEARKMVLRTHTTCVTIKHLADKKPDEARIFSLGRVFRNEKLSFKHLAEFNQVEGVVVGKHITLRDLMGIQKEFYRKIGLTKVKFWPTFFPYTEPSLQSMVYNEKLGKWIELFGMGIFRPEVTKPLGITKPVLAWGGGIERIAMLKFGLDDVREFYNNNLSWLRTATKCQ